MSSKQKFSSSAMQSTQTNGGETSGGAVGVCVVGGCSHGGEVRRPFLETSQGTVQGTPPPECASLLIIGECVCDCDLLVMGKFSKWEGFYL